MIPTLEQVLKVTFPPATELQSDSSRHFLDELCVKNNIDCTAPRTSARLLDKLVICLSYFTWISCKSSVAA